LPIVETDNSLLSSFTHLRVLARARPDAQDVEICFDPGAGRSVIGAKFLSTLEHTIERRNGKIRGVNGKPVKINKWATFSFFLPGKNADGQPTLMKFTKSA